MEEKIALSVKEAAALLGVSPATMYRIIRIQGCPSCKLMDKTVVNRKALIEWFDKLTGVEHGQA